MTSDLSSFRQDSESTSATKDSGDVSSPVVNYVNSDRSEMNGAHEKNFKGASKEKIWHSEPYASLLSIAGIGVMSCLISLSHVSTRLVNVSLLYLLVVVLCGAYLGRLPALISSICGFIAFNLCLVQPTQLDASSECIALAVFLITALVIGQLTALLKARAEEAELRRSETEILAQASWTVASEPQQAVALNKVMKLISNVEPVVSVTLKLHDPQQKDTEKVMHSVETEAGRNGPRLHHTFPVMLEETRLGTITLGLRNDRTLQFEERRLIESLVHHIAALLERERLLKAESRAQALLEADALKTALLAMVSHDFRSPLTTIKASVSALLEDGRPWEPAVQKNLLEAADQETDRLNKLVGNILTLSKLEGGAWKPRREAISVQELISSTLSAFSDEENERICLALPESPGDLFVDPVQMEQVLHNLIENALKYSPADKCVEVDVGRIGAQTQFDISDRGIGLPQGDELNIFEKFYRAEPLMESNIPGLGIGLAVCKGLVEANGGSLTAHQRDGGGAIFRMTVGNMEEVN